MPNTPRRYPSPLVAIRRPTHTPVILYGILLLVPDMLAAIFGDELDLYMACKLGFLMLSCGLPGICTTVSGCSSSSSFSRSRSTTFPPHFHTNVGTFLKTKGILKRFRFHTFFLTLYSSRDFEPCLSEFRYPLTPPPPTPQRTHTPPPPFLRCGLFIAS